MHYKKNHSVVVCKRLLGRYQRLYNIYNNIPVKLSFHQVADILICTPRYARTLLMEMQTLGWLTWTTTLGRSAKNELVCHLDQTAIDSLLKSANKLSASNKKNEINLNGEEERLQQDTGFKYTVPLFRPIPEIVPAKRFFPSEQRILQMVHVGLMRFYDKSGIPGPGIAHTLTNHSSGLIWTAHLRTGLHWHNGERVEPEQILNALRRLIGTAELPYVKGISLTGYKITFNLTQKDILFPIRLANPACTLSHPKQGEVGLGPFKIMSHDDKSITLSRSPYWFGVYPLAAEIKFRISVRKAYDWATVRVESDDARGESEVKEIKSMDSMAYLTVNYSLDRVQRASIVFLIKALIDKTAPDMPDVVKLHEEYTSINETEFLMDIPRTLSLAYSHTPQQAVLVELIRRNLEWRGCKVKVIPLKATHWRKIDWRKFDVYIGYIGVTPSPALNLAEIFHNSELFKAFVPERVWKIGCQHINASLEYGTERYKRQVERMMTTLRANYLFVPLYGYNHTLITPKNTHCPVILNFCWPDFTKIWNE